MYIVGEIEEMFHITKFEKNKTTTISLSNLAKLRLASILRKNETFAFGLDLLLLNFAKPKFGEGGAYGNRTVYPRFSDEEISKICEELSEYFEAVPEKKPREIDALLR